MWMGESFGGERAGGMMGEGLQCIGRWLGEWGLCRRGRLEGWWWKGDQMGGYMPG